MHVMILESFQYLFFTFGGSYQFPQEFCAELCLIGVRLLLVANTAIVLKQTVPIFSRHPIDLHREELAVHSVWWIALVLCAKLHRFTKTTLFWFPKRYISLNPLKRWNAAASVFSSQVVHSLVSCKLGLLYANLGHMMQHIHQKRNLHLTNHNFRV